MLGTGQVLKRMKLRSVPWRQIQELVLDVLHVHLMAVFASRILLSIAIIDC
jgi:hypothetical protein